MHKLKVAIFAAGMIANAGHIPAWQNLQREVQVVGVFNHHLGRAQNTAQRHGIPHAFDDSAALLSELEPDIVSICTPNALHRTYAVEALEAGAHVFCEKPISGSYADAVAMYQVAERFGRELFVSQTGRFSSTAMSAKEFAVSGQLGEMYFAECSAWRRRGIPTWGRFHIQSASGGGPLYDLGVHALDLVLWLMGNPRVISASGVTYDKLARSEQDLVTSLTESGAPVGVYDPRPYDPDEFDVEDMAAGLVRLEDGGAVDIRVSWAANVPDGAGNTLILGTEGGLQLRPLTLIRNMGRYQVDVTPKVPRDPDIPFYGHWRAAEHFCRVVRHESEAIVRQEEVLNVMRALDGLYRSARLGRAVELGELYAE
jgi:predicted dehydrogenase